MFSLKIIASNKVFYDGKCQKLTLPTIDGEKGVLTHHENMLIAISMGPLRYTDEHGEEHPVEVGTGFAQIFNNRVSILVDTAERPEDIDVVRAREALERAQEQLRQKQSIQEYHHSQASMARAMSRLKIASKYS